MEGECTTKVVIRYDTGKNVHRTCIEKISNNHHMDNGLREKSMNVAFTRQFQYPTKRLLQKGVYVISSILGKQGHRKSKKLLTGSDELTDYSKIQWG